MEIQNQIYNIEKDILSRNNSKSKGKNEKIKIILNSIN